MAAQFRVGGDPESYMEAPVLTGGGEKGKGGGGSFFAKILDALGIHKQVAKGPAEGSANDVGGLPDTTQSIPPPPELMPVINEVESAFKPMMPMASDWGQKYLESSKPLRKVDPNQGM